MSDSVRFYTTEVSPELVQAPRIAGIVTGRRLCAGDKGGAR